MDDFNVISEQDRHAVSYGACVGGTTLVGMAVGRFVGLQGVLAGAAVGLAYGLLTCKKLAPAIERKIFSSQERLSDVELASVLRVVRDQTGVQSKADAMYLLSQVRALAQSRPEAVQKPGNACVPPRTAAAQLLAQQPKLA
jgi:hypothetical protein